MAGQPFTWEGYSSLRTAKELLTTLKDRWKWFKEPPGFIALIYPPPPPMALPDTTKRWFEPLTVKWVWLKRGTRFSEKWGKCNVFPFPPFSWIRQRIEITSQLERYTFPALLLLTLIATSNDVRPVTIEAFQQRRFPVSPLAKWKCRQRRQRWRYVTPSMNRSGKHATKRERLFQSGSRDWRASASASAGANSTGIRTRQLAIVLIASTNDMLRGETLAALISFQLGADK